MPIPMQSSFGIPSIEVLHAESSCNVKVSISKHTKVQMQVSTDYSNIGTVITDLAMRGNESDVYRSHISYLHFSRYLLTGERR